MEQTYLPRTFLMLKDMSARQRAGQLFTDFYFNSGGKYTLGQSIALTNSKLSNEGFNCLRMTAKEFEQYEEAQYKLEQEKSKKEKPIEKPAQDRLPTSTQPSLFDDIK